MATVSWTSSASLIRLVLGTGEVVLPRRDAPAAAAREHGDCPAHIGGIGSRARKRGLHRERVIMGAVEELLSSIDGPVIYVPNGGNAGDSLINVGFYQLAARHGIPHTTIKRREVHRVGPDSTVIIGGGGALVPEWSATPRFIANILPGAGRVVVLPHSIRDVADTLRLLRRGDAVVCRERYSYDYCLGLNLECEVQLDDDIALSVSVRDLMAGARGGWPDSSVKNAGREGAVWLHRIRSRSSRSVQAFRTDREADPELAVPRRRINDFSTIAWFASGTESRDSYSARRLLQLIDLYDEIHTDRLHVVIGSVLMGKRVVAYSNNYHKVRGVIEMSLGGYSDLEFRELGRDRPD